MSAFAEFVAVAIALFLWESTLWLPLRGVALRREWFGKRWKILDPGKLFATREVGMVAMFPLPPDFGLAPCEAPPLLVDPDGNFLIESSKGDLHQLSSISWDDLEHHEHHLVVPGWKTRMTSRRSTAILRRAKQRGATPEAAVRISWRLALSPDRSRREWRRWKLAAGPLRWYGLILAIGFLVGLPLAYIYLGTFRTLMMALWLWCIMGFTAGQLWWLGKRVYPDARAALRMDAMLSLLVPFHAMRAWELAAVHAMAATHPVGLILSSGDTGNPWLGKFVRRILHPRPDSKEDAIFSAALLPHVSRALSRWGKTLQHYENEPAVSIEESAGKYCRRCHGVYLSETKVCPDCGGLELHVFSKQTALGDEKG